MNIRKQCEEWLSEREKRWGKEANCNPKITLKKKAEQGKASTLVSSIKEMNCYACISSSYVAPVSNILMAFRKDIK